LCISKGYSQLMSKFYRAEGSQLLNEDGLGLSLFYAKQISSKIQNSEIVFTQIPCSNNRDYFTTFKLSFQF
jgi:hypothetical protein